MLSSCRLFKKCLAVRFPMKNISSNFHVASMWATVSKKGGDDEIVYVDADKMAELEEQHMDKQHEEEMAHQTELDAFTEQSELAEDQESAQTEQQEELDEREQELEEHEQELEEVVQEPVELEQKSAEEQGHMQEEHEQHGEGQQHKQEGIIFANNDVLESIKEHAKASIYANEEILETISGSQIVQDPEEATEATAGKFLFKEPKEQLLVDGDTEETTPVDFSPGRTDE